MNESLSQKIRNFICVLFNHFPKDKWNHEGVTHANCVCCNKVVSKAIDGFWE